MPTRKRTRRSILKALSRPSPNNTAPVTPEMWLSGEKMCRVCGVERPRYMCETCVNCYENIASGIIEIFEGEEES